MTKKQRREDRDTSEEWEKEKQETTMSQRAEDGRATEEKKKPRAADRRIRARARPRRNG